MLSTNPKQANSGFPVDAGPLRNYCMRSYSTFAEIYGYSSQLNLDAAFRMERQRAVEIRQSAANSDSLMKPYGSQRTEARMT